MKYIEQDCIIEHNGRQFRASGATVTPERIVAYPLANGDLGDWHGSASLSAKYGCGR